MSDLKRLNGENGPIYIRPSIVDSVSPSSNQGWSSVQCGRSWYYVKGATEEVHAAIFPGPIATPADVLQGAWNETWEYGQQHGDSMAHSERVLILRLAERLGVAIDREQRTPTSETSAT